MTLSRPVPRSIRAKLLTAFSLLVASIAMFVFVVIPPRLERQAMRAMVSKAESISEITAYSLGAALYFSDTAVVREVLNGAARSPDVKWLVVTNASENLVIATPGASVSMPASRGRAAQAGVHDKSEFISSSAVMHGGDRIGEVSVAISLSDVQAEVTTARRLTAVVGILIVLVGLAMVYAISTLVTRPLRAVSDTVERIAEGELSLRVSESADTEVAQLARAFNRMVEKLASAQSALSASNQLLEARVDSRTAELREAINDLQRAQTAAEQSEALARSNSEMLQSLIDVAPQAIISVDLDWKVTRWNKAADRMFGWTSAEVMGKPLPYIPEELVEGFTLQQTLVERDEWPSVTETVRLRKDGTRINVLVGVSTLRDHSGREISRVAVVSDITERKLLEDQLRQSQKMEAIGRLAGGVAHDFNNILTVITSSAALLAEGDHGPDARADLEAISTSAMRAAALTRQLLLFSRKQIINPQSISVNEVVRDMRPMLRRLVRENIQITTKLDGDLGLITADPTQMQQVVMNLVVNASDAMPDGGTLAIETRNVELDDDYAHFHPEAKAGEHVQLTVSDSGTGMNAETIGKIFEPFFTTKGVGIGTGLGLATTYAVVSQIGGHIRVYSEPGLGTSFKLFLPRSTQPATTARATPMSSPDMEPLSESRTVLLVEDEVSVRQTIKRTLERLGFEVLEAEDGERGLKLAAEYNDRIDVVVTDLMMPGMNGRTFADRLRTERELLPVIFMSGYTDDTVNKHGLLDASHAFVQKPFNGVQLVKVIRELLRDGGPREPKATADA